MDKWIAEAGTHPLTPCRGLGRPVRTRRPACFSRPSRVACMHQPEMAATGACVGACVGASAYEVRWSWMLRIREGYDVDRCLCGVDDRGDRGKACGLHGSASGPRRECLGDESKGHAQSRVISQATQAVLALARWAEHQTRGARGWRPRPADPQSWCIRFQCIGQPRSCHPRSSSSVFHRTHLSSTTHLIQAT